MPVFDIDEILGCPECHAGLVRRGSELECPGCHLSYPVEGGVPRFVTRAELPEYTEELRSLSRTAQEKVRSRRLYRILEKTVRHPLRHSARAEAALRRLAEIMPENPRILNLGSGQRGMLPSTLASWQDRVVNLDLQIGPSVDVAADAHKLPFLDGSFDLVLMICVLEHVRVAEGVVLEVRRVLKEGGTVFSTTPFLSRFHGESDYRRWSVMGLRYLFRDFAELECEVDCGPASAMALSLREFFPILSDNRYYQLATKYVWSHLLVPFSWADIFLSRKRDAHKMAQIFYVLARRAPEQA